MKRFAFLAAAACLVGCAVTSTSRAMTIIYTEQFTASGSLGTSAFTDTMVTLTGTGDTANVFNSGSNVLNVVTATVTVAALGPGAANVTDPIRALDQQGFERAGFGLPATMARHELLIETSNSLFATYDLKTSIGPVPGSLFVSINPNKTIGTDQGTLTLTSFGADSTFTATVVPEPASLTLMSVGGIALLGYGWRRRTRMAE